MKRRNPYNQGNGYNNRAPKATPHDFLKRRICEIGEPSKFSLTNTVENLGRLLGETEEQAALRATALNSIAAVVREQPHKIPLLGVSVCIANATKPLVGQIILEMAHSEIQKAIDQGNWGHVKLFTRFVAVLSTLIEGNGVYNFLEGLLTLAKDNANTEVGQEIYILVLLTLPILYVTPGSDKSRVKEFYESTKSFQVPEFDIELLEPFYKEPKPYEVKSYVELVKQSLENIDLSEWSTSNGSSLSHLLQTERLLEGTSSASSYKDAKKHKFPSVSLEKGKKKLDKQYASPAYQHAPRLVSRFYLPGEFETVPPMDSFENVLLRDIGTDLIQGMDFNRREVARQLITLDLFFEHGMFTEPGITMDRLERKFKDSKESGSQDISTWKVEDCALDIVLDHLFRLPRPVHYPVYYHSILIEMCIMAPEAVAPVFGRAVRFLFKNLDSFDLELYHVYLNWFSHHLTNFDFMWKWSEWVEFDKTLETTHPKRSFIKQLIAKELRLSYPQRVRESLPEEFQHYVLSDEEQDPVMKFLESESGYEDEVKNFLKALRELRAQALNGKVPPSTTDSTDADSSDPMEIVRPSLDAINQKVIENSVGALASFSDLKMVDILVTCICHIGNRSISHAKDWIKRSSDILKQYTKGDGETVSDGVQKQALDSIMEHWKGQPKVGTIIIQYFVEYGIVDAETLVDIVLSDEWIITSHGFEQLVWLINEYPSLMDQLLVAVDARIAEDGPTKWWLEGVKRFLLRQQKYPVLVLSSDEPESELKGKDVDMADESNTDKFEHAKSENGKSENGRSGETSEDTSKQADATTAEDVSNSGSEDNGEPQAKRTKTE